MLLLPAVLPFQHDWVLPQYGILWDERCFINIEWYYYTSTPPPLTRSWPESDLACNGNLFSKQIGCSFAIKTWHTKELLWRELYHPRVVSERPSLARDYRNNLWGLHGMGILSPSTPVAITAFSGSRVRTPGSSLFDPKTTAKLLDCPWPWCDKRGRNKNFHTSLWTLIQKPSHVVAFHSLGWPPPVPFPALQYMVTRSRHHPSGFAP